MSTIATVTVDDETLQILNEPIERAGKYPAPIWKKDTLRLNTKMPWAIIRRADAGASSNGDDPEASAWPHSEPSGTLTSGSGVKFNVYNGKKARGATFRVLHMMHNPIANGIAGQTADVPPETSPTFENFLDRLVAFDEPVCFFNINPYCSRSDPGTLEEPFDDVCRDSIACALHLGVEVVVAYGRQACERWSEVLPNWSGLGVSTADIKIVRVTAFVPKSRGADTALKTRSSSARTIRYELNGESRTLFVIFSPHPTSRVSTIGDGPCRRTYDDAPIMRHIVVGVHTLLSLPQCSSLAWLARAYKETQAAYYYRHPQTEYKGHTRIDDWCCFASHGAVPYAPIDVWKTLSLGESPPMLGAPKDEYGEIHTQISLAYHVDSCDVARAATCARLNSLHQILAACKQVYPYVCPAWLIGSAKTANSEEEITPEMVMPTINAILRTGVGVVFALTPLVKQCWGTIKAGYACEKLTVTYAETHGTLLCITCRTPAGLRNLVVVQAGFLLDCDALWLTDVFKAVQSALYDMDNSVDFIRLFNHLRMNMYTSALACAR